MRAYGAESCLGPSWYRSKRSGRARLFRSVRRRLLRHHFAEPLLGRGDVRLVAVTIDERIRRRPLRHERALLIEIEEAGVRDEADVAREPMERGEGAAIVGRRIGIV